MKKKVFGRQFKRDTNERKALFKNLLTALVLNERIKTTEAKAKAIKGAADKLITKAKKGKSAERHIHPLVHQKALDKLIKELGPRFVKRDGGYTRIIRLPKNRVADNASQVYLEWTEKAVIEANVKKVDSKKSAKKTQKVKKTAVINKSVVKKSEEKTQKPGFLKQLVTRQKKG